MPYFTLVGHSLFLKNSLERDVAAFLNSLDRAITPDEDLEELKAFILNRIDLLNKSRNRCKPVEASFYDFHGNGDSLLSGFSQVNFIIYKAKS